MIYETRDFHWTRALLFDKSASVVCKRLWLPLFRLSGRFDAPFQVANGLHSRKINSEGRRGLKLAGTCTYLQAGIGSEVTDVFKPWSKRWRLEQKENITPVSRPTEINGSAKGAGEDERLLSKEHISLEGMLALLKTYSNL